MLIVSSNVPDVSPTPDPKHVLHFWKNVDQPDNTSSVQCTHMVYVCKHQVVIAAYFSIQDPV